MEMDQLELLLVQFLRPDNEARMQAEEHINRLAKDPAIIPSLVYHVRAAHSSNVRQLAAVLLRKKIIGHWMRLTTQVRDSVKSSLLESITMEHSHLVRRASANVMSVIAKHAVPAGEWPDLLPFLFQCSQSAKEDHREVALIIFSSLTETIGDLLKPHFTTLVSVFMKSLKDEQNTCIKVAALKAVGALAGYIDTEAEVLTFRDLIPHVLNVSRQCLRNGNDEVAILAFEIFDELVESPAPILGPSVFAIVQFALEVSSDKTLEINIRYQALQMISWLAKYKPKTLVKHKVVGAILAVVCPLLAEGDNRHDEDDISIDRAAAEVLDTMAMSLPRKHVFPSVFEFSITGFQSSDPSYREAAVMSLGVISEGCFEAMKTKLEDVLYLVLLALRDGEQVVRGAASFALGQFAEHLQPEVTQYYEKVLPCIFTVLSDSSADVQEKAYYSLAAFCENLETEILPYLEPLMGNLLAALESGARHLQETCMSAIGSSAAAAKSAFVPYTERVLNMMKSFMVLTKDEDLPARAHATELVGIIAMAVGRQSIEHVLPAFIEAAVTGFSLDFSQLREYTHGFFSNVAEVLEEGLVQYLPRLVPLALASCSLDDGTAVEIDVSDEEDVENGVKGISSDEDNGDVRKTHNVSVRTGILDEKAAATQALGLYALHTKSAFAPYLDETLKVLKNHAGYFHQDVRLQAMISIQHVLSATEAAFPNYNNQISPQVKHVFDCVMEIYLRALNEDDDKETVSEVCTCIAEMAKNFGYSLMEPYIGQLSEAIAILLRQEAICQQTGESDSDLDDEDSEHDEILMDAVTDLLPALAKCMGANFEPILRQQFDALMKFVRPTRPPGDRTMVVACLAEVAQEIGPAIGPYVDVVMPVVIKELASTEATNRRNAAFCVGELCKNGGEIALKYFKSSLFALQSLFGDGETIDAVRDNAAGAIARMIVAQPQAVPLSQVLHFFISALPLKDDLEESPAVYNCLCNLIFASNSEIRPFIPQLIHVFAQVASSQKESAEVKSNVGRAVSQLLLQYREQMQPILNGLPPEAANALACVMAQG
eukprot:c29306_g1_i2 orf=418-3579(+)